MMPVHSIRWRLPLSYAAIACLATLALGGVLLTILREYYTDQERDYLLSNVRGITRVLASAAAQDVPMETLDPQLRNLAFFSSTRIRVMDETGAILVDTGVPDPTQYLEFYYRRPVGEPGNLVFESFQVVPRKGEPSGMGVGANVIAVESTPLAEPPPSADIIYLDVGSPLPVEEQAFVGDSYIVSFYDHERVGDTVRAISQLPAWSTPFGFTFGERRFSSTERGRSRSNQSIEQKVLLEDGHTYRLVLSDGPTYGSEIVNSVARGWAVSGGIAVLLAAAAGWLMSSQIGGPLLSLTAVTARMSSGDLTARADLDRRDEIGALAGSFNAMAARIEQTVITLQRFVADAAHEFHTPLTALRTNLELAADSYDPNAIRRAQQQVERLEGLTNGLLKLSRIESAPAVAEFEPVDLAALVRASSEVYASRAEQRDMDFTLEVPDEVVWMRGNAEQMRYLVDNLLDNAIKFTPDGGSITIRLESAPDGLALTVSDTGIGIPPDEVALLFERFRRGRNAVGYPGSGLGLAMVKVIATSHGGAVQATSGTGGTCMAVALPAAIPAPGGKSGQPTDRAALPSGGS